WWGRRKRSMVTSRNDRTGQRSTRKQPRRKSATLPILPLPLALFVNDRLSVCNDEFRSVFLDPSAKQSLTLTRFLGRDGKERLKSMGWDASNPSPGRSWGLPLELRTRTGGTREYQVDAMWTTEQDVPALQILLRDTTEHNTALRELRRSKEQLTSLIESLPLALGVIEGDAIVFANTALAFLLGYANVLDAVGRNFSAHVASKFRSATADQHAKIIGDRLADSKIEFQALRKDRTGFPAEAAASYVQVDGRDCVLVLLRDITFTQEEKKRAAAELESWRKLNEILQCVSHPMDIIDACRGILDHVLRLLTYDFGMLYLPDTTGSVMIATVEVNIPEPIVSALRRQEAAEGIIGWVMKTEEPLSVRMEDYPPHLPYRSLFESAGVRAIAYVPLRAYGSVHAVLMLGSTRTRTAPEHDSLLLKHLTSHLGARIVAAQRHTALKEHVAKLEAITAGVPHILYLCSPSGAYTYMSPGVHDLVGYNPADFYRNPDLWRNLLHPDDRTIFSERVTSHAKGNETIRLEYRILPKGKATYHWLQDDIHYTHDGAGSILGLTGSITDISERKNIETLIESSFEVFRLLTSRILSCYAIVDENLYILAWDDRLQEVTGILREEILYRKADSATVHLMTSVAVDHIRRALEGLTIDPGEEVAWARFEPVRSGTGEILAVICLFRDRDAAP
ncbi:MAG: PAS domain S-box protein, partial [Ignavibacteria bacterium]|nr:PAS domain S-box protein [Ignavibacteria bacterium]